MEVLLSHILGIFLDHIFQLGHDIFVHIHYYFDPGLLPPSGILEARLS